MLEQLGRQPLDADACATRSRLLNEGRLAHTAQLGDGRERRLIPSTPEERPSTRALRERQEKAVA